MSKHYPFFAGFLACVVAPFLQGATPERGQIYGDDVYVNCEYRIAAHFPGEPKFQDITYRDGVRSAPARQFYYEKGKDRLSVTIANFADGPGYDQSLVDGATAALRSRGQVRYAYDVFYDDPDVPGRQFNIGLPDGRQLRASVYMVNRRLYITESATVDPNDFAGFLFEESVSLIDENGTDYDSNPVAGAGSTAYGTSAGLPPRQYDCSRLYRKH